MFGPFDKYIAVFLTALVVTYLLTPLIRILARRLGAVDLPNERRPHKHPTPRGGGLAVVLGVQAACLVALLVFPPSTRPGGFNFHWWLGFAPASLVLLAIGLADDIHGLRAWKKLAGQVVAAFWIYLSGTHFGTLLGYQLPPFLDAIMVVFWIVAVINAYNLIDGLDGLASGLAIISATGLCGVLFLGNLPGVVLVLVALIGACLAFLRYNFHPATIFLGDTGSMFIGLVLGVLSLQTFTKSTFFFSMAIPILVLGIPIYDTFLAIWRRSVRRIVSSQEPGGMGKRLGIMQPDLEHLHHRLVKSGLSTRRVTALLYVLNGGLVLFGLLMTSFQSHAAGIFLLALLAAAYVLLRHMAVIEVRETGWVLLTGLRRPTHALLKSLAYPVWDMFCLAGALAIAMRLFESPGAGFWHSWFLDLPIWVTPTFSLLAISRTYLTVWTRARTLDAVRLLLTLQAGLAVSLGIALLIDPSNVANLLLRVLIIGAIGHPAILGVRVFYRCLEEIVVFLRSNNNAGPNIDRVLLYGTGGRSQLFLKERGLNDLPHNDGREIVGLLDDEPSLHFQWVYGCLVLGGMKDLPHLINRHHITSIVITSILPPVTRAAVEELASKHGLRLTEWSFGERKLDSQVFQQSPSPALEPTPASQPAVTPAPTTPSPRTEPSIADSKTLPSVTKLFPLKGPG